MKVVLILCDGMRPDALPGIPQAQDMMQKAAYAPNAQTVMPSVTLPCHMSLFHSVDPDRHGTTTNDYMPQVRPIPGLCEVLARAGKNCSIFYDWEQLRDLTRPSSLYSASFRCGGKLSYAVADKLLTDEAIAKLTSEPVDFAFLYMGDPDAIGHGYGWMGEQYLASVQGCWENIARVASALDEDTALIITADHGGHGRGHGADIPEDMTIPVFVKAPGFAPGSTLENVNIKDLAPTIATLMGVAPAAEWEGKSLI